MINWWLGDWWFGILGIPLSNNPFHKGILGIQTTNPNHRLTISWLKDPVPVLKMFLPVDGINLFLLRLEETCTFWTSKHSWNIVRSPSFLNKLHSKWIVFVQHYCWWKKSCFPTWDDGDKNPVNNGINYQPQLVQVMVNEANQSDLLQKKTPKERKDILKKNALAWMKWFNMKQKWHLFTTWVKHPDFFIPKKSEGFSFLKQQKNGFVKKSTKLGPKDTCPQRAQTPPRRDVSHHQSYHASHVWWPVGVSWPVWRNVTFGVVFFPGNGYVAQQNWPQNLMIWKLEWLEILWIDKFKLLSRSHVEVVGFQVLQAFCSKIFRQDAPCDVHAFQAQRGF